MRLITQRLTPLPEGPYPVLSRSAAYLDLTPPESVDLSLWRSLVLNFADKFAPERLPPLELTSKPVDVGILFGDVLNLPWYRTVFSNLSDVISPDMQAPLELTSRPVDVGELLGDEISHPWWNSLLSQIRDRLSPERLAPLRLTAQPIAAYGNKAWLQVLDWSNVIDTPKIFLKDAPDPAAQYSGYAPVEQVAVAAPVAAVDPALLLARVQLKGDLARSRFRQKIWISLVTAEIGFLIFALFKFS